MPVDRKGLSPIMVGRDAKLHQLLGLLPSGRGGGASGPEVVLVGGEAGIGKSRLVAEVVAALPVVTSVLIGRAGRGASSRPFSLLLDAIEPMVSAWEAIPHELERRKDSIELLLAPVSPDLDRCDDRQYGPDELLRGAVDLVRYLAPWPSLLVFEDLHEADPESIGLFGRLAITPDLGALLLGTFRPEELSRGHSLSALVEDLERRRSITHVSLARLSPARVGDLLEAVFGRPVSWHVVETVHGRTGGNPFFIEELLLAADQRDPEGLVSMPLPWNLTEIVLRHLDGISDEERRVVDAAAVLGSNFPFDILAGLVAIDEDQLISVLRRFVHAGLLVESESDVFSFRHALTREAVAGQLLGRQRRRLHERALAVMCELGSDDYIALAHHAQGAGRHDQVVDFARQGTARYLRTGSTHQALGLAELGLAEDGNDVELHRLASEASWTVGMLDVARSHGLRWRQLAAVSDDRPSESAAIRHLARVEWEAGNSAGQRAYALESLALAELGGPSEDLAYAMALMSEVEMLAHTQAEYPNSTLEAVYWADRALTLADELGAPGVRPGALVNKGTSLTFLPGRLSEGGEILEQARDEARQLGDTWSQLRASGNLIMSPVARTWPLGRIQEVLDELQQLASRTGREGRTNSLWASGAAALATHRGDQEEVRRRLADGQRLDPFGLDRWWFVVEQAQLAVETNDLAEAEALLKKVDEAESDDAIMCVLEASCRAELEAVSERPSAAEWLLRAVESGNGADRDVRREVLGALVTLLRWGTGAEAARTIVEKLDRSWPEWPDEGGFLRRHVEGALLEAEGRVDEALAAYGEALADPFGYRPAKMAADAEMGVTRCLLAKGLLAAARVHADAGAELLTNWPGWRAEQAASLVRRCRPPVAGPADRLLTPRESEVAGLLAEGLTNGQIAERLYIATKTASVHVSNILAKLGMSTRAQIAGWAVRHDLSAANAAGRQDPPGRPA